MPVWRKTDYIAHTTEIASPSRGNQKKFGRSRVRCLTNYMEAWMTYSVQLLYCEDWSDPPMALQFSLPLRVLIVKYKCRNFDIQMS